MMFCTSYAARSESSVVKEAGPATSGKAIGTNEEIAEEFRKIRQQIKDYCENFVAENL